MALSKAAILSHTGSCATREVHVPAWADENGDDVVLVRGMTIKEYELNLSRADDGKATAAVLSRCVLANESGMRLFSDDDIPALAELPAVQVGDVSRAIMELSGMVDGKSPDDAVADAEKNSEPTASEEPASS